jgi:hypothetical protein
MSRNQPCGSPLVLSKTESLCYVNQEKNLPHIIRALFGISAPCCSYPFCVCTAPFLSSISSRAADSVIQNDLEFVAPLELDNIEIFSGFGDRIHPIFNKKMLHTGVDFVQIKVIKLSLRNRGQSSPPSISPVPVEISL